MALNDLQKSQANMLLRGVSRQTAMFVPFPRDGRWDRSDHWVWVDYRANIVGEAPSYRKLTGATW